MQYQQIVYERNVFQGEGFRNILFGDSLIDDTVGSQPVFDTGNWKVYVNDKIGFKLQYPGEFVLIDNPLFFPYGVGKDTAVVIQKIEENGSVDGTVTVKKIRNSLKNEVAKQFSWSAVSLGFETINNNAAFVLLYFTGSANDEHRTYLFPKDGPTFPGDPGEQPTDILVANIQAGIEYQSGSVNSIWDEIVRTLYFTD